jgi:hypothetical protein
MAINNNLYMRYLKCIKACVELISNHSNSILELYKYISIDEIINKHNFELYENYLYSRLERGDLTLKDAFNLLLFIDEDSPIQDIQTDFYKFHLQESNLLLNELDFLKHFISEDLFKKLKSINTQKEIQLLEDSLTLIKTKLNKKFGDLIEDRLRYVNVLNSYGIIQSSTISKDTNLIFLSLNNPKFLIAEQIIHESTHIRFNKLIKKAKFEDLFNFDFSWFSPFADKVRSIEMIANGHLAYSSVKAFYEELLGDSEDKKLLDFEVTDRELIKKRIAKIDKLLSHSSEIIYTLFKDSRTWSEFLLSFVTPSQSNLIEMRKMGNLSLTRIERAEVILGLNTDKISRITIPISFTKDVFQNLNLNNFLFSNAALLESKEESLEFFSNLCIPLDSHLDSEDDDYTMVHCYIGRDHNILRKAVQLDIFDLAGELFQIPKCCQAHFNEKWNFVVERYSGDFVSYLIDNTPREFNFSWEINPIAMYFDFGFTWHFPCSFSCKATKKLSRLRFKQLSAYDPMLAESLRNGAIGNYILHENNNYCLVSNTQNNLYTSSKTADSPIRKSMLFE